jgi:toxin YhaV
VSLKVGDWTLLFHDMMIGQIATLADADARARAADPDGYRSNSNAKVLAAIAKLVLRVIPAEPGKAEYRIGNTMGSAYRHWSRAKFGQRFRLFFRYDSAAKIIIYAWVNDETTLRNRGGRNDPYAVFQRMLDRGTPPDTWRTLVAEAGDLPAKLAAAMRDAGER